MKPCSICGVDAPLKGRASVCDDCKNKSPQSPKTMEKIGKAKESIRRLSEKVGTMGFGESDGFSELLKKLALLSPEGCDYIRAKMGWRQGDGPRAIAVPKLKEVEYDKEKDE